MHGSHASFFCRLCASIQGLVVCLNDLGWFTKVIPRTQYLHVLGWVRLTTFRVGKDVVKVEVVTWATLDTLSTITNELNLLYRTRYKATRWKVNNEMTASAIVIIDSLRGVCDWWYSSFWKSQMAFSDSHIAGIWCLIMIQFKPLIGNKILLRLRMAQTDWWAKKTTISHGLNHVAKQMWYQTVYLFGTPRRGWRNDITSPLSKLDASLRIQWGFFSSRRSF